MNCDALQDDSLVGEEVFVFGSFRLIPAQRILLEDEKPLRLGSRRSTFSSRWLKAPARPSGRTS